MSAEKFVEYRRKKKFSLCRLQEVLHLPLMKQARGNSVLMQPIEMKSSMASKNFLKKWKLPLTYEDGAIKLNQSAAELGTEAVTEVRYPSNGTSASAFGVAIAKGAPHMAAAKAFVNWVTSAEGQSAMAEYMQGTLRFTNANYTSPENAWLKASSDITWVTRDVPTLTAQKAIIFTDKFPPVGDIEQAEDRFIATTEEKANKAHVIYELVLKGTYDEQIYELLEARASAVDAINNFKKYMKGD